MSPFQEALSPSSSSSSASSVGSAGSSNNKKTVTFSPKARMKLAIHINDYDNDEIEAAFYKSCDYHRFRQDARSVEQQQQEEEHEDRIVSTSTTKDRRKFTRALNKMKKILM